MSTAMTETLLKWSCAALLAAACRSETLSDSESADTSQEDTETASEMDTSSDGDADADMDTDSDSDMDSDTDSDSDADTGTDMDTDDEEDPLDGMHIWFGNLHSHSGASDGEGEPAEVFTWARDEAGLDFYAMTDHSEMLFGDEWDDLGTAAALFDAPGEFAALRGFEWSHPINGHMCIYETADFNAAYTAIWISYIYEWLDEEDGLGQFNHPGREIGVFSDLELDEPVVDNVFAIETGNKGDGNNDGEFMPYYIQALDNGWRVAPTSNQDNHELSVNSHRTAYVGAELSAAGLLEAMRARRLYSTDDPDIEIVFKAGETWMGSTAAAESPLVFTASVADDEPIFQMRVVTNGGEEAAVWTPPTNDTVSALWTPEVDAASGDWFYLEVTSVDENDTDGPYQIAVTAPIWVE